MGIFFVGGTAARTSVGSDAVAAAVIAVVALRVMKERRES
jgi:hypothetical protein